MVASPVRLLPQVERAIRAGHPVVALESSVFAQGLPPPANRRGAVEMLSAVERKGALPAITAVIQGTPALGVTESELERLLSRHAIRKVSARDLAWAAVRRVDGATTVAASLAIAGPAGCRVFATGGIGGVHRGAPYDESADLVELARTSLVVVCAGAKSILDLEATMERLETLGVPVIGYRTDQLPGFFTADTGIALGASVDSAAEVARAYVAHCALGRSTALLIVQPPPPGTSLPRELVERAVELALIRARDEGVTGAAVTPFLLSIVEQETGGRSLETNLALLRENAALAAETAREIASVSEPEG